MKRALFLLLGLCALTGPFRAFGQAAPFEEAVVDVGNVGLTVTNAGYLGRPTVRNNPTGPPSFEYPLNSGVEHLFDAGLWIGARRQDGTISVRTGAVTSSAGYRPGAVGYEFAQTSPILHRSSLPESEVYTRFATSHQDYIATFTDTFSVLPGTQIPMPDPQTRLGADVTLRSYAWNFPFTEYFVILNFDIVNVSGAAWDSVYVGLFHDLVVRNVNTTNETGSAFFNKNGLGYIDSLHASYAFNAGGTEETVNTYGAVAFLGAEWTHPQTGETWFFHPNVAERYRQAGLAAPQVNPRWWKFSGGTAELSRPLSDQDRYRRMATPYPDPRVYETQVAYEAAREAWATRLRTEGRQADGNWIGLTPIGPFARVEPGDTLQVTYALVGALKPEALQGQAGKPVDTPESRSLLASNLRWAHLTYAGEDNDYDGRLDPGEDVNGNGRLDRYLIPEPPRAPRLRVELEQGRAVLYWNTAGEATLDPVTGTQDFEGYRIYRSNPGDDLSGNILDRTALIAQYDRPGNRTGFNNGLDAIRLPEPVTFPGDTTRYAYRFEAEDLLSGWQYLFAVTAFDEGDLDAGLPSFESSRLANAIRIFPGTPPAGEERGAVGVYPNPYRINAAWDGSTSRTRRLNFYNLPPRAEVRIYTLAGEIVAEFEHDAATYQGDIRWYDNFSAPNRQVAGGEHSWDLLSENGLNLSTGLYLFSVRDKDSGRVQTGKFAIIK